MSIFTAKKSNRLLLLFLVLLANSLPSLGQTISGTVFRDFNSDGTYTSIPISGAYSYGEPGVGGVTVTAYNAGGAIVATATSSTISASAGTYTLTVGNNSAYRIEFNTPTELSYFNDGFHTASGTGTSVQFVNGGSTGVNFGVSTPNDYCQPSPPLIVPCYVSGDPLPTNSPVASNPVLVNIPYSAVGQSISETPIANAGAMGSVWGSAYQRETRKLFSSAFLKRHVGLGSAGLGGIYVSSNLSTTPITSVYVDLENAPFNLNLGASGLVGRTLPTSGSTSSTDPLSFSLVGAAGLGSLALSSDGATLYTTDLYNRQLLALHVGNPVSASASLTAADLKFIALPNPGCTNGVARPFALEVHNGKVYIGVVCTGETGGSASDLYAHIYAMNEGATTIPTAAIFSFRLNYTKGPVHTGDALIGANWEPWATQFSQMHLGGSLTGGYTRIARPQPILSDISFADNGDMILGFADRGGHQIGYRQRSTTDNSANPSLLNGYIGGDILRAHYSGTSWVLEKNGTVGSLTSAGAGNGQGPGTPTSTTYTNPSGEFYYQENYSTIHTETIMGSALSLPGTNQTIVTLMDPFDVYSGGFGWFNNITGASDRRAQIYDTGSDGGVTYGKANGLGVIKALCNPAPIQIGNRVWLDSNNNGIQDPGEAPLAGVKVTLTGPGITGSASVTTNAAGEYYFSNGSGTNALGFVYSLTGLVSGGAYTLTFPTSASTASLSNKPNSATGTNSDNIDTNPSTSGIVSFTLGQSGDNNYSYDAGYVPCLISVTALANNTSSATVCQGTALNLTAQVSPAGSYTYAWSAPATVTLTGANTATATATGLPTGVTTFTVTVSSSPLCSTVATVSVTVNPAPTAGLTSPTICAGQSATLTATGGTSYTFSNGTINTTGSLVVSPVSTTAYSVTVANASGCTSTTTAIATVNPLPTAGLTSASVCVGQSATLTATGGTSYTFSNGTINTTGLLVVSPVSTTAYSVTVANASGCTSTTIATVTVNPLPTAGLTSASVCVGQSMTLIATGGTSYIFSNGTINTTGLLVVSPVSTTAYSVTIANASGCTSTTTAIATVNPLPTAGLTSASVCAGQSATLTATGGTSYTFSNGTINTTGLLVVSPISTTAYSVTVANASGCTSITTASVIVNPLPTAGLTSPTICAGQSTTLTATGGSSYTFSNGTINTTGLLVVNPVSTTAYSVTVANASGCRSTTLATVTVNPLPTIITSAICNGLTTYNVSFTATPGASVTANLGTVSANQVTGIPSGQTVILTTTLNGCSITTPITQNCQSNAAGLGDYVFLDANQDGVQNTGDTPIQGVTVILYTNGVASATTVTSASGFYSFTGLTPGNSLAYSVEFATPSGYTPTLANAGTNDDLDSDADPTTGRTQSVTLAPGDFNPTLDAGFAIPSAELGDYVFLDANKDGSQDADDTPIQGVVVTLYINGVASTTTVTDADGLYSFTGLTPGNSLSYSVGFTTPAGYTATLANVGSDDELDSDADPITGRTASVTLAPGEFNPTLDAGYYLPAVPTAGLGDYVFLDVNKDGIQNTGDTPMQGVTVTLYTNGVASATIVTSATGFYSFTGLTPGNSNSYVVGFTAPTGYTATTPLRGTDRTKDSNADPITGRTASVTLAPGEFNPTLDAGYLVPTPVLSLDKFVSSSKAKLGDILTYTIVVANSGSTQATNVIVRDSSTTGLTYIANSATAPTGTTFTHGTPSSNWTIANLSAGQSLSLTFQAKVDSLGILYNKASIPGDTATVCTSIPYIMCAGDSYAFTLTAPTGRTSYKWFRNNVEIIGQTTNVLEITAPGAYSLAVDDVTGKCPDFSCCPFIVEEDTLPTFQATAIPVTCVANIPQANGKIALSGFKTSYTYQYSLGTSFNASASLSGSARVIPAGGVLTSVLVNPGVAQSYTVRVYNASGCYTDVTVLLMPTICGCPADVCVPYVLSQTKRTKRIGDPR